MSAGGAGGAQLRRVMPRYSCSELRLGFSPNVDFRELKGKHILLECRQNIIYFAIDTRKIQGASMTIIRQRGGIYTIVVDSSVSIMTGVLKVNTSTRIYTPKFPNTTTTNTSSQRNLPPKKGQDVIVPLCQSQK